MGKTNLAKKPCTRERLAIRRPVCYTCTVSLALYTIPVRHYLHFTGNQT
ncbi:MAG: hypothetical protein IJR72_06210 [Oscillospiraceae bacterium]|nr:hypothetical protein [Oscillospiraceae bacterium]